MKNIIAQNLKLLFLLGLIASIFGCTTAGQIELHKLPLQTEANLAHNVPALRQAIQAHIDRDSGKPNLHWLTGRQILIAPAVYGWSVDEVLGKNETRAFPLWWPLNEHAPAVQWITTEVYKNLVKNVIARGYRVVDSDGLKSAAFDVSSLGGAPRYNCDSVDTKMKKQENYYYKYVANKLNCWKRADLQAVTDKYSLVSFGIFPRIDSTFTYQGHAKMNGEAIVIYNVSSLVSLSLCSNNSSERCDSVHITEKPLTSQLVVPAEVNTNEDMRKKNNNWAAYHAAQYYGEVLDVMLNQLIATKEK